MSRKKVADEAVAEEKNAPESAAATETAEPEKKGFAERFAEKNPIRVWTQRYVHPVKYRQITDETLRAIIFQFDLKPGETLPPQEVIETMRSFKKDDIGHETGLVFKETRRHGKAWMLPNDHEGRMLAEKIDQKLQEIAHKMEQSEGVSR